MSYYDDVLFDGTFWNFILLLGGVFAAGVLVVLAFFLLKEWKHARLQSLRHDYYAPRGKRCLFGNSSF